MNSGSVERDRERFGLFVLPICTILDVFRCALRLYIFITIRLLWIDYVEIEDILNEFVRLSLSHSLWPY